MAISVECDYDCKCGYYSHCDCNRLEAGQTRITLRMLKKKKAAMEKQDS